MADIDKNEGRRRFLAAAALGASAGMLIAGPAGIAFGATARPPVLPVRVGPKRFEGKVVLVTGGTSGIGRAAVRAFAAEGAKVAFCGRRQALGSALADELEGRALYVPADVRVEGDVKSFVERAVSTFGALDVALDNAGITIERPLHEYTAEEWDDVVHTNLRGVFFAMKYQIPHMLGRGGSIVVTSSSNAIATTAGRSAYSASKRALVGLVQSAALDYAGHGIRVNALVPGTTDTPLVRRSAGMESAPEAIWRVAASQWARSHVPGLGRMATAEEIAAFALTLASDEHPYLTGAALVIDGGKTAHAG